MCICTCTIILCYNFSNYYKCNYNVANGIYITKVVNYGTVLYIKVILYCNSTYCHQTLYRGPVF